MNRLITLLMILIPSSLFGNVLYFPQVAYGGGYTTTFFIMNTGTTSVSAALNIYSQNGVLQVPNSPFNAPPGGVARYSISSTKPLAAYWAVLDAGAGTVQGVATFDLRSTAGTLITTAGVLGTQASNTFAVPVDLTGNANTGVAIANITASPVKITLQLLGSFDTVQETSTDARFNSLASHGQVADFVTTFFPDIAGTLFTGILVISTAAGAPVNALAATALTVKEGLLSALPVVPISFLSNNGTSGGTVGTAFQNYQLGIEGTASIGGKTVAISITSAMPSPLPYAEFDNTRDTSGTGGLMYIDFGNPKVSGNTVTFSSILDGTYLSSLTSSPSTVISGTLTLTAGTATVGTTVSGTVQFSTTSQTVAGTITATIVSSQRIQ